MIDEKKEREGGADAANDKDSPKGELSEHYREKRMMERFGNTVQNLRLHIHRPGSSEAHTKVTIPLSGFHVGEKLLPKKVKEMLGREGIDLSSITDLYSKKGPRGVLIEIEDADEKLVILID